MSVFSLGSVIKNRRESLGITQEDLADGICAVPTLSRIENGERMPTKNNYELLFQRLGFSAIPETFFTDKQTFQLHELKYSIRHTVMGLDYDRARALLAEFIANCPEPSTVDSQFIRLHKTMLSKEPIPLPDKLRTYEETLRMTCPKYQRGVCPKVMAYDEIILLNNISICYGQMGDYSTAIQILTGIKDYYDSHIVQEEEAMRTQPMILYNLSKNLGLIGQYDACIEVCDRAIRFAKTTRKCSSLAQTLYNKGYALLYRNQEGDYAEAKRIAEQSIFLAELFDDTAFLNHIRKFYQENFKD